MEPAIIYMVIPTANSFADSLNKTGERERKEGRNEETGEREREREKKKKQAMCWVDVWMDACNAAQCSYTKKGRKSYCKAWGEDREREGGLYEERMEELLCSMRGGRKEVAERR